MGKVLIIAEIGVNHNGDINLAKKMIDKAYDCGADIAKFQTGNAESVVSKFAEKAEYQKKTTGKSENQLEMIKKLLLPMTDFFELKKHCAEVGIEFLSTPFDLESIEFLNKLGLEKWKIPSGEVTNLPYLIKIAKTRKPVIMSTGMCDMEEIKRAIQCLKENGTEEISLLHCTTEYPAPKNEVNLKAMDTLKEEFNTTIGYSDHTEGIDIPIAAVARGAMVLEKHFTLDRNMEGPDHKSSLEPDEFQKMVTAIRNVESALGSGIKTVSLSEEKNRAIARKSIVAKCGIKKGEYFSEENITTKRPGTGISPMQWFEVIGMRAPRNFMEDELIEL